MENLKNVLMIVGVLVLFVASSAFAISYIGATKPFGEISLIGTVVMGIMNASVVTFVVVSLIFFEYEVIAERKYKRSALYRLIQGNLKLTNKHA